MAKMQAVNLQHIELHSEGIGNEHNKTTNMILSVLLRNEPLLKL